MSETKTEIETMQRLLGGSLAVWGIDASVEPVADEPPTVLIRASHCGILYVTRQRSTGLPACWEVRRSATGAPTDWPQLPPRRYAAVPGLLRGIRAVLDPDAPAGRLVIGSQPA